jgi:hypothetical protein
MEGSSCNVERREDTSRVEIKNGSSIGSDVCDKKSLLDILSEK